MLVMDHVEGMAMKGIEIKRASICSCLYFGGKVINKD
jgi:hypothetical protein